MGLINHGIGPQNIGDNHGAGFRQLQVVIGGGFAERGGIGMTDNFQISRPRRKGGTQTFDVAFAEEIFRQFGFTGQESTVRGEDQQPAARIFTDFQPAFVQYLCQRVRQGFHDINFARLRRNPGQNIIADLTCLLMKIPGGNTVGDNSQDKPGDKDT